MIEVDWMIFGMLKGIVENFRGTCFRICRMFENREDFFGFSDRWMNLKRSDCGNDWNFHHDTVFRI